MGKILSGFLMYKRHCFSGNICIPGIILLTAMYYAAIATAGGEPVVGKASGQTGIYETPLVQRAKDIVPPELGKSKYHKVVDEVVAYEYTNYFTVSSDFGQFEAYGEDMLRIRIQEVNASNYSAYVRS